MFWHLFWLAMPPMLRVPPSFGRAPIYSDWNQRYDSQLYQTDWQERANRYEAVQRFNRANDLFAKGDLAAAEAEYEMAIRYHPPYYQAYEKRAEVRERREDLLGAMADYQAMVRLFPNNIGVWHNMAKISYRLKDFQAARIWAGEALNRNGDLIDVRLLRARASLRLAEPDQAREDFEQILRLEPRNAAALVGRGKLYHREGKFALAQQDFDEAIRAEPNYLPAFLARAALRLDMGLSLAALSDCDSARARNANSALVWYLLGNARTIIGQTEGALSDYQQAAKLSFGDGEPEASDFRARGDAYFNQGRYKEALEDYAETIRLNPDSAEVYLKRAALRLQIGDRVGAIPDLRRARQIFTVRGDTASAGRTQAQLEKTEKVEKQAMQDSRAL